MPMPKFCPACGSGERVLPILDRAGYDLLPPTDPVIFVPRSGQVRCTNPVCGARFTVTFYKRDGNDTRPKAEATSARNGNEGVGAAEPTAQPPGVGPRTAEPRVVGGTAGELVQVHEGHILLRDDEARALIARLEHRIDLLERTVTR